MISEFLSVDLCNFIDQIILLCNFNSSTLYPEKVNILCYTTILCYIYQHLSYINTWSFEHSGDISCSLLVNPSHNDESWAGQNTCLWIYTLWIYSLSTLENTDENRIFFVRSPHHKHFGKAQHLALWALWWHQLFSTH